MSRPAYVETDPHISFAQGCDIMCERVYYLNVLWHQLSIYYSQVEPDIVANVNSEWLHNVQVDGDKSMISNMCCSPRSSNGGNEFVMRSAVTVLWQVHLFLYEWDLY